MEPRPILLVGDPLPSGGSLDGGTVSAMLSREGYIVLRCPPVDLRSFRVLAPCPFTQADVATLRLVGEVCGRHEMMHPSHLDALASIAARMEAMR